MMVVGQRELANLGVLLVMVMLIVTGVLGRLVDDAAAGLERAYRVLVRLLRVLATQEWRDIILVLDAELILQDLLT